MAPVDTRSRLPQPGNNDQTSYEHRSHDINSANKRLLACPFSKYDNTLFGRDSPDEAYHTCATCRFKTIAHLKQHLQRNHYLPRHYCFRCCHDFASEPAYSFHSRQDSPCQIRNPPLYCERISNYLVNELGLDRKNPPGTDRIVFWHKIYNTFFPGAAERNPVTPYYEGPDAEALDRFNRFNQYCIQIMPEILPIVQQRLEMQEVLPNDALIQQESQQEASQRYLQHIRDMEMPHLPRSPSDKAESSQQDMTMQEAQAPLSNQQTGPHTVFPDDLWIPGLDNFSDLGNATQIPFDIHMDFDQQFDLPVLSELLSGTDAGLREIPNSRTVRRRERETKLFEP